VLLNLDNVLCLDFEASALGPGSYPIEVAVVDCASTACSTWLIAPTPAWLSSGIWSDASAAVHQIPRFDLLAHGRAAAEVAAELASCCGGKTVLCDGGEHDWRWLVTLYAALDQPPPFQPLDHHAFACDLAGRTGRRPELAINRSEWEALSRFPLMHRAGADARRLAETLRLIAGYP
jgi:hypothetical protein